MERSYTSSALSGCRAITRTERTGVACTCLRVCVSMFVVTDLNMVLSALVRWRWGCSDGSNAIVKHRSDVVHWSCECVLVFSMGAPLVFLVYSLCVEPFQYSSHRALVNSSPFEQCSKKSYYDGEACVMVCERHA